MATQEQREQARALAVTLITPTLDLRSNRDLIAVARRWDSEIRTTTPGSPLAAALANGLLRIYRILDRRSLAEFAGEPPPSFVGPGPIGLEDSGSPLTGLIEDIPPFGNTDIWITYLPDPPERRPRRQRPRPPPPPPTPNQRPPPSLQPGPQGVDAGRGLGGLARIPGGTAAGPISEYIPPAASTSVEMVVNLVMEALGAAIGPIVGGLIMAVGVVDTFEGTRRTQARAAKAWGARLGLMALAYIVDSAAPDRVGANQLRQEIRSRSSLERPWQAQRIALTSVEVEELMTGSLGEVASAYNEAIRRSLIEFGARLRRENIEATESDMRDFRRLVGRQIIESALEQMSAP